MGTQSLPGITFVIPTYNESENIDACLDSIFRQKYPRKLIEVIVVDDYSKDDTLEKAKRYPVRILYNGSHDPEVGKMIGFKNAKGELFFYLDADVELRGKGWIRKMIYPLYQSPKIIGVFTRKYAKKGGTSLERYFAMEPLHRDIVFEVFSPSIDSTILKKERGYELCEFRKERIPPAGRCLYRTKELSKYVRGWQRFMELDFLVLLVSKGKNRFAYVPQAGIYHHHVRTIKDLVLKRKRNVQRVYLPKVEKRLYRWFDLKDPLDLIKILFLVIYSHSLVPPLLRGIYKSIKFKDPAGMWEVLVPIVAVDVIIFSFLTNSKGIRLVRDFLLNKK